MNDMLKEKIEDYKKFHHYEKYYPLEIFIQKPLSSKQGAVLALHCNMFGSNAFNLQDLADYYHGKHKKVNKIFYSASEWFYSTLISKIHPKLLTKLPQEIPLSVTINFMSAQRFLDIETEESFQEVDDYLNTFSDPFGLHYLLLDEENVFNHNTTFNKWSEIYEEINFLMALSNQQLMHDLVWCIKLPCNKPIFLTIAQGKLAECDEDVFTSLRKKLPQSKIYERQKIIKEILKHENCLDDNFKQSAFYLERTSQIEQIHHEINEKMKQNRLLPLIDMIGEILNKFLESKYVK